MYEGATRLYAEQTGSGIKVKYFKKRRTRAHAVGFVHAAFWAKTSARIFLEKFWGLALTAGRSCRNSRRQPNRNRLPIGWPEQRPLQPELATELQTKYVRFRLAVGERGGGGSFGID